MVEGPHAAQPLTRPSTLTSLRPEDVHAYVARTCFKTGPPGQVGVELEWFVVDLTAPAAPVPIARTRAAIDSAPPLPHGSHLTYEPGGQLELSSLPAPDLTTSIRSVTADVAALRNALRADGLHLLGAGVDPLRPPRRQLHTERYDAMAAFFAARGPASHESGPWMMCSTAAVQVCLDAGLDAADVARRWSLLHVLGPVLVATFANSSRRCGEPSGASSTRQTIWADLDPRRTGAPHGDDPVEAWTRYALAADVIAVRGEDSWLVDPGFTFGQWVDGAGPRPPTRDDLDYHFTTLFPPVRPRGWFEVRYLDAQRGDDWIVPLAVTTALVEDRTASAQALEAIAGTADRWDVASYAGVADPVIGMSAARCMEVAIDSLRRTNVDTTVAEQVADWAERYTFAGRSPADDVMPATEARVTA